MTTREQRLERKRKRDAEEYCEGGKEYEIRCNAFEAGSASLAPMLLRLAEAIEEIRNDADIDGEWWAYDIANKALAQLDAFLDAVDFNSHQG